jgi:uncharacterized repeat protein (TIGR02543 family)
MPANPTRSGHTFTGWNTARDGSGTAFTDATPVTDDITVYAQWAVIRTGGGGGGGWSPPTIPITPDPVPLADEDPSQLPFVDVAATDWFYPFVRAAWEHQVFQGTSHNLFTPQGNMTRAMFVQVLANLEGVDLTGYQAITSPTFADTLPAAWYFGAVEWAAAEGLVQGVGNDNFAPSAPITREQMATMLNNYVVSRSIVLLQDATDPFTDQDRISE